MTKKNLILYLITNISIFIPSPPYLGYGIILVIIFNISLIISITVSHLIHTLNDNYRVPIILLFSALTTVLMLQLVTIFSPIISLTISFIVYFVPLSVLAFDKLFYDENLNSIEKRTKSFKVLIMLTITTIFFFTIREILAFGSISYPSTNGIITVPLFGSLFSYYNFFWASIPGALIQLSFFTVFIPFLFREKKKQIETSEQNETEVSI